MLSELEDSLSGKIGVDSMSDIESRKQLDSSENDLSIDFKYDVEGKKMKEALRQRFEQD